jgi:hypothetical protein
MPALFLPAFGAQESGSLLIAKPSVLLVPDPDAELPFHLRLANSMTRLLAEGT